MKFKNKSDLILYIAYAIFFILLLCARAVYAATIPAVLPKYVSTGALPVPSTFQFGNSWKGIDSNGLTGSYGGSAGKLPNAYVNAPSYPDITVSIPATATAVNPEGFVAKVVNAIPVLESSIPFTVSPPVGGSAVAGSVATASAIVRDVPLNTGMASAMGKAALGVVGGAAAVLAAPEVVAVLLAAQVGMQGYDFYTALKANKFSLNSDGSASNNTPNVTGWVVNPYPGGTYTTQQLACKAYFPAGNGVSSTVSPNGYPYCFSSASTVSGYYIAVGSSTPNSVAATQDQLSTAIAAAVTASAAAVDIANLYTQKLQLPLPVDMPLTSVPAVPMSNSQWNEYSRTTDATGNVTSTQKQGSSQPVVPASTGSPITYNETTTTKTVINNVTNSTTVAPVSPIIPLVVVPPAAAVPTVDFCLEHPNVLACADVSNAAEVPNVDLKTKDINLTITPVNVGASSGVCPPPIVLVVPYFGTTVTLDGAKWLCSAASLMMPLNVSLAWLSAGFIVMGGIRKNA